MSLEEQDLLMRMVPADRSQRPGSGGGIPGKRSMSICPHCKHKFNGPLPAQCPVCMNATVKGVPDTFDYAPPGVVRMVGAGVIMLGASIPLHFVGIMAALIAGDPHMSLAPYIIKGIAHGVAAILVGVGVWLMTQRDPKILETQVKAGTRTRIFAGVTTAIWLVLGYFAFFSGPGWIIHLLTYLVLVVQIPLAWEVASYCRYVALRVPDDGLAWGTYTAGCMVAVYCVVFIGIRLLGWNDPMFALILTWPFPLTPVLTFVLMWCAFKGLQLGFAIWACGKEGEDRVDRLVNPRKVKKYEGGIDL